MSAECGSSSSQAPLSSVTNPWAIVHVHGYFEWLMRVACTGFAAVMLCSACLDIDFRPRSVTHHRSARLRQRKSPAGWLAAMCLITRQAQQYDAHTLPWVSNQVLQGVSCFLLVAWHQRAPTAERGTTGRCCVRTVSLQQKQRKVRL